MQFDREHYVKHFSEIDLNKDQWFREKYCSKIISIALAAPFV